MTPRVGLVLAMLMALPGVASAQAPLEIDILEGYLEQFDVAPELPHCGRHDGTAFSPAGPIVLPGGGTNAILREHKDWHLEVEGRPGSQNDPSDDNRFGDYFVHWHREFIGEYEAWRDAAGHPPLAAWDSGSPIPPEHEYDFPGRGCSDGRNNDPSIPLPTWATIAGGAAQDPIFGHAALCDFKDVNQFGKAIALEYHPEVHGAIGGDMAIGQGPRDPIFWSYHRFIDDVATELELQCPSPSPGSPEPSAPNRAAPGGGLLSTLVVITAVLRAGRRGARR